MRTPLLFLISSLMLCAQASHKTENIIFVMTDGLRWQELFDGAEEALMTKEAGGVENPAALKARYWRNEESERRAALMPFVWSTMAKGGQIFGNRAKQSDARVTNSFFFSYPGYSETLCGFADGRIDSNDNIPNPNVTVLEWLNAIPAFHGKVAAFGAWNVIASAVNGERGRFPSNAGWPPFNDLEGNAQIAFLNRLKGEMPRMWKDEPFDTFPYQTALAYLRERKPRVLYLSLGETDEWAHDGKYELYLDAAHRVDTYLNELWSTVQSMDQYRGKTTLIFSPDHGRGHGPEWKDHGQKVPESKYIWMAFLGPDTPARGERTQTPPVLQNQIAATLAALLGEDYSGAVSKAGHPIAEVLGKR